MFLVKTQTCGADKVYAVSDLITVIANLLKNILSLIRPFKIMKNRDFLLLSGLFLFVPSYAQTGSVLGQSRPKADAPVVSVPVEGLVGLSTMASVEPTYDYPEGLSCLGIHSSEEEPVCNYLSPNRIANGDCFLWAPLGKDVKYSANVAQGNAYDYNWILPGTNEETATTADVAVTYKALGRYPFPTLECTNADGSTVSYQAEGEILVSGKAEISTANCRKWGTKADGGTYRLGHFPLNGGAGYIGGTNSSGMSGYGNLFMTAHGNAHITGVNVYFVSKPEKYEDGQQLLLQVWYPSEDGEGNLQLDALPLEADFLPVSEIRETTSDECPVKNAAIGEFRFEEPLQIFDKPLFFVTVTGFGEDPSKADIRMLTEVDGQDIPQEQATNLLAHNSFVNYSGMGYTLPINYFGTPLGASFMICPIVDNEDGDATGISSTQAQGESKTCVSVQGRTLTVENAEGSCITVFDLCGAVVSEAGMHGGQASATVPCGGVYLVKVTLNGGRSDVCKVHVGR